LRADRIGPPNRADLKADLKVGPYIVAPARRSDLKADLKAGPYIVLPTTVRDD
jgi:hypothetical protein